jgi:hypothetical protein
VTRTGNAAEPSGNNRIPFEDYAKSDAPQTDREEAPVTDQGEKDSEVAEALVMSEPLLATPPVSSDHRPVSEEKEEKQEASENEKMTQPDSSDQDEKVEKDDMPEKSFPAAQNMPGEKTPSEPAQIKKPEKKPDISTEKTPSATDNKTVMTSSRQRERENELTRAKIPVPAIKPKETEKEVKTQAMLPPAGTGQNIQQDLHQKAETRLPLPMQAAPETGKEVTAPSGPKEIASQKLPDVNVSPEPNLSVSEEKPLQDISAPGLSPEMTLPSIEEKAASPVSEKIETTKPPAVQAKNAEKNDNAKADLAVMKQKADTSGKVEQPKAITIPAEARVKKKGKSGEVVEDLPGKEPSLLKGDGKPPAAKNRNSGLRDTQRSSTPGSSGSEGKPGHKKNAGVDKTGVSATKQTIQKPVESGGSLNDLLKQAHGSLAESVEIGAKKPGMELKADGENDVSPLRLGGGETDKSHKTLHLASKLLGQLESASEGPAERPAAGTEVKPPVTHAAVEGPANAGGL